MTNEQLMMTMMAVVCGCCAGYMIGTLVICVIKIISGIKEKRRRKKEAQEYPDLY